jgi:hypothetical protein
VAYKGAIVKSPDNSRVGTSPVGWIVGAADVGAVGAAVGAVGTAVGVAVHVDGPQIVPSHEQQSRLAQLDRVARLSQLSQPIPKSHPQCVKAKPNLQLGSEIAKHAAVGADVGGGEQNCGHFPGHCTPSSGTLQSTAPQNPASTMPLQGHNAGQWPGQIVARGDEQSSVDTLQMAGSG